MIALLLLALAAPVGSSTTARVLTDGEAEIQTMLDACLDTAEHGGAEVDRSRSLDALHQGEARRLRAEVLTVAPPEPVESPVAALVRGALLVVGAGLGAGVGAGGCAIAHCEPLPAVGVAAGSGLLGGALTALVLLAGGR